jgi:hypothetical protein
VANEAFSYSTDCVDELRSNLQSSAPKLSTLESLLNEILDMIIENLLPEKSDVIAFGFSSERLWPLVRRHIQREVLKSAAPWAGKKIAFQGSYSTDLPASFLEDGLAKKIIGGDGFGEMCDARRVFWGGATGKFKSPPTLKNEQLEWRGAVIGHAGTILIPDSWWKELEKDMDCTLFFPQEQPWILRNLTTRESVSSETLGVIMTTRSKNCSVHGIAAFNYILLMRTC